MGTGENQPISGDQLSTVLGADAIQNMAGRVGVAPEAVSGQLAQLLPQAIDRLTPNGALPPEGAVEQNLGSMLKGLFGGA